MHTILGAGGSIGKELAKILPEYTDKIRLVSRNPQRVNESDELFSADLTDATQVSNAVEGSEIVYLLAGLPYKAKVWADLWPKVMSNTIEACKAHNAKLVFFDNIYMYDQDHLDPMDENTPIRPSSKKGVVRANIAKMILDEVEKGTLTALIARSADFYGPGIERNGMIRETVFKNLASGKKANWLCSVNYLHSATYTPDAARGTAMLATSEDTYNQVWHLPTASNPPSGLKWIELAANELKVEAKYQLATPFIVKLMGIFIPVMREMPEMLYQYDRNYVFLSEKFEKRFNFSPTSYEEGIREIVRSDYS